MTMKILLGVLYLSGWLVLSKCCQYHFVNESFTWHEAHSYCRKNYIDLASIGNSTEMNQLINTVSSAGYNSEVWIGVYFTIHGYHAPEINDNFWNWENQTGNEPFLVYYFCGGLITIGWQWYNNCSEEHPFICYNGTYPNHNFIVVNERMDWFRALRYCRKNFTDLTPPWFSTSDMQNLAPKKEQAWIGLIAHPNIYWSDGKDSSFSYWDESKKIFGILGSLFGAADLQRSGKWRLLPSDTKLPFVCYDNLPAPLPTTTKAPGKTNFHKNVIKINLKQEDSSVDLNDGAVKANLLKKLQDKVKEKGLNGVSLKWREQPDGAVFHKEEKNTKKEENKKTEL